MRKLEKGHDLINMGQYPTAYAHDLINMGQYPTAYAQDKVVALLGKRLERVGAAT